MSDLPILSVRNLSKIFGPPVGGVRAVNNVSFDIAKGETYALVGESGCGKSTLGRCVTMLETPSEGEINFQGQDLTKIPNEGLRRIRRDLQMIFQDPYGSLNPRKTVGSILSEPMRIHSLYPRSAWADQVGQVLAEVGLLPVHAQRHPHEFSGGQRQRISIARALTLKPKLIVSDEAVSALDVSVQSQILNLMVRLQKDHGMAYLFISHDLGVVQHISDRVGVMYLGRIVESANTRDLFRAPRHPYTRSLLSAVPKMGRRSNPDREFLQGELPSPLNPPSGCTFHPRCPLKSDLCVSAVPEMREIEAQRKIACHHPLEDKPSAVINAA
ncbi:ABC transporter ATP-binding protein [Limoniibacter endophyticus]|uniref:ABC transporter ATP-binding protein n=1 Tax=Limoniibacter endophyticus TaxID=1565040 RepID=A0A8J3DL09_9HYPH|nr:dipeptide ABC transporter ATP-binding protein [Limoniibacter endophyticus]GHC78960.1 ABC transporter ATP-binding protein [Limoniibacter endophyticus]